MTIELCITCGYPTGKGGECEDSIFINYPDEKVGPLCDDCRVKHLVCEECGEAVHSTDVMFDETHEGCGGRCS